MRHTLKNANPVEIWQLHKTTEEGSEKHGNEKNVLHQGKCFVIFKTNFT